MRTIAPAKINLTLEVLGKRPDGYHEIRSVMQTIDLCDDVSVASGGGRRELRFENVDGRSLAEDDMVMRAAHLLAERAGVAAKGHVRLAKRIPVAAGLGGGSSDAAATLRLL